MKQPRLTVDILTLFPKLLEGPLNESMARQAQRRGAVRIRAHSLRDYTMDRRRTCDARPFGGGAGMVMKIQPIFDCLETLGSRGFRIMVSSRGERFSQALAARLARKRHLIFICGHYEGVDERVHEHLVDQEISVGDFVTTGGELPALCFIDAIIRVVPGVLGNERSLEHESFTGELLDFPQYTHPRNFRGWSVPSVLLSGNHSAIRTWRTHQRLRLTRTHRPDLLGAVSVRHGLIKGEGG